MSDNTTVHIGENSPEEVAFKLMERIASVENIALSGGRFTEKSHATRDWILSTYSECIRTVKTGFRPE